MKEETLITSIDKFVKFKFTLKELQEVAPLINSEDFAFKYKLTENIQAISKESAQVKVISEIRDLIAIHKNETYQARIINLKNYKFHIIAASVLLICGIGILKNTTGYNNESNFRKAYIETVVK